MIRPFVTALVILQSMVAAKMAGLAMSISEDLILQSKNLVI